MCYLKSDEMENARSTNVVDGKYIKNLMEKSLERIRIIGHQCRNGGIIGLKRRQDIICHKCRRDGIGRRRKYDGYFSPLALHNP